jgi:hypothetical protein
MRGEGGGFVLVRLVVLDAEITELGADVYELTVILNQCMRRRLAHLDRSSNRVAQRPAHMPASTTFRRPFSHFGPDAKASADPLAGIGRTPEFGVEEALSST